MIKNIYKSHLFSFFRKYDGYFNVWLLKPAWTGKHYFCVCTVN